MATWHTFLSVWYATATIMVFLWFRKMSHRHLVATEER
jgi:hypothetical protein